VLARLLASIGLAALQGEITATVQRAKRRAILTAIAVVFWLLAFAFALAALTVWLAGVVGPLIACAAVAGGFAVVALILQLAASAQKRRKRPPPSLADIVSEVVDKTEKEGGEGTVFGLLAIVAVAGYLLGRRILRR